MTPSTSRPVEIHAHVAVGIIYACCIQKHRPLHLYGRGFKI